MEYGGIYVLLWILFAICCVIEAICTPWYLKAMWPTKCRKSLILKMVCSSMFFAIGVLSILIADNTSPYAITMLIGLGFGWVGDYFLHAKESNAYFVTGFVSFLIGHIVYIVAYLRALPALFADYKPVSWYEIAAGVATLAVAILIALVMKIKFNPPVVKYGILVYALILITMVVKASVLGIRTYLAGGSILAAIVLTAGSVFFLLSDGSLAVILFCGQKKNYPLKIFNIVTYFWGQIMLASSILFIAA